MINIIKKESDKVYSSIYSIFISFPFCYEILNLIKSRPIRLYNPTNKTWELPETDLDNILNIFNEKGYTYQFNDLTKENREITKENPKILEHYDLPDDIVFKTKPYSYQEYGIAYGLHHNSFLLGDTMGLGKTLQALNIAAYRKQKGLIKRCLIICGVNTLKLNWLSEITEHTNEKGWILGTRFDKQGKPVMKGTKEKMEDLQNLPDCTFIITNVETLRICEGTGRKRKFTFVQKINDLVKNKEIGMIILDEAHKCRNVQSLQGKALLELNAPYKLPMSGTFFYNNPLDLYVPLKWIGEEEHSFWQFRNFYCILGEFNKTLGTKNLDYLKHKLEKCMLRRTSEEVLDLPPKNRITEFVEMSDKQEKIYQAALQMTREEIDKIKASNNPLAMLIRLRQATGFTGILSSSIEESAKLDRMEEIVEEEVLNGNKVVVFSQWEQITEEAKKRLTQYNPLYITGSVNDYEREKAKTMFQEDDIHKVIIGTIGAMGTGLTLTRASTCIFLDSPWTMADKVQAEDRIYRIGTTKSVNIITLVTKNTIDEQIENIVYKKGVMGDYILDGKLNKQQINTIIDEILS